MSEHVVAAGHGGIQGEVELAHRQGGYRTEQQHDIERLRFAHFCPEYRGRGDVDDNEHIFKILLECRKPLSGNEGIRQRVLVINHYPVEHQRQRKQ